MHKKRTKLSFLYIDSKLYNRLSLDIKHCISFKIFKTQISDWLGTERKKCYYLINWFSYKIKPLFVKQSKFNVLILLVFL